MTSDTAPQGTEAAPGPPARPTTVELLDRLIAFDTTSRNSNLR